MAGSEKGESDKSISLFSIHRKLKWRYGERKLWKPNKKLQVSWWLIHWAWNTIWPKLQNITSVLINWICSSNNLFNIGGTHEMIAYIANFTYLQKKCVVVLMIHKKHKNLVKTYTVKIRSIVKNWNFLALFDRTAKFVFLKKSLLVENLTKVTNI